MLLSTADDISLHNDISSAVDILFGVILLQT